MRNRNYGVFLFAQFCKKLVQAGRRILRGMIADQDMGEGRRSSKSALDQPKSFERKETEMAATFDMQRTFEVGDDSCRWRNI